jgi:23S rRNA pseudouridine1911/1915/1917 synthase
LDKGTTGLIVVAKNQKALEELVTMFALRKIEKTYHTLVMGTDLSKSGTIKSTIGRHPTNRLKMAANVSGKEAITHYKVLSSFKKMTYLQVKIETGRTHQIRVHMAQILRHPILCDPLYGNPGENLTRLGPKFKKIIGDYPFPFLHAKTLSFDHPFSGEKMSFDVDPPKIFLDTLSLAKEEM